MSKVNITALTDKSKPVIETQYKSMTSNWILKSAFKSRGLKVSLKDNLLTFDSQKGDSLNTNNLIQVENFFYTQGLKKNKDYKIEVSK